MDVNDFPPDDHVSARAWVRAIVTKYLRSDADVDDVAQDAMLRAHRYRASFRGESRYSSWLYRIAVSAAISHIRRRGRMPVTEVREDESEIDPPSGEDLLSHVIAIAEVTRARAAVEQLGDKYPVVFEKRYAEGMSESEVAAELGLTTAAVKARAHRGRLAAVAALQEAA